MKRFASILLVIVALSSCNMQNSTVVKDESKKESAVESVDPNVFYLSELPEIGSFSGISPVERFYDEPTYDFIPSNEYGEIIPYVGSYRVYETDYEDWNTSAGYTSYGFCTPDGKIVMDASYKNAYVNFVETDDGFGYYTVTREQEPKIDAPDEYTANEILVIPRNGSWCLTLDGNSWVSSAGGGYFSVCDYPDDHSVEQVRTLLYDYNGNLVHTLDGIDNAGVFYHGLMMVSEWTDEGYTTYFINEDGETVLGPYGYVRQFNEHGIAIAGDNDISYLITTNGEKLTKDYSSVFYEYSVNDMSKSVFVARHYDDRSVHDLLSATGELIATVDTDSTYVSLRFPDDGDLIYYYTKYNDDKYGSSEKMVWKRVSDGSELISKEFGVSPNSYMGHDNCYINIDKESKKAILFDADGETVAAIDDVYDILAVSDDNKFIAYCSGTYDYELDSETYEEIVTDTRVTHIYDVEKGEILYSLDKCSTAYFGYNLNDQRFLQLTVYIGSDVFGGLSRYWLFDTENKEMVFEDYSYIEICSVGDNTYINACTENSSTLYDENLNIIKKSYNE